jgi:CheY-like chemotaxis protein
MFKIFIADDDEDDRLMFKTALDKTPYDCELNTAVDGQELLEKLEEIDKDNLPDLIILDLNMPRKDGKETLAEIRRHPNLCCIPVVIFTTSNTKSDSKESYMIGASSYITKPSSFKELCEVVEGLIEYWSTLVFLPSRN